MNATPKKNQNRERTVLDLQCNPENNAVQEKSLSEDDSGIRICPGCGRPAAGKKGGLVIACGKSFFHVDCYTCKKCQTSIEIEDRVLLDLDGLPLCASCFHKCNICQLAISEKVIYVGDHSYYHPECFKCKKCSRTLDEEKFAKSRQSLYCKDCHDKRIAKMKKRMEKKAEMERLVYGGIASPPP
ncbi:hypothetical protein BDZ97DRAFT_1791486 [Flammula alnicola]|nr:hypothetical protein BDZ97DRAFT_1791486 [Flammula alnicola]